MVQKRCWDSNSRVEMAQKVNCAFLVRLRPIENSHILHLICINNATWRMNKPPNKFLHILRQNHSQP